MPLLAAALVVVGLLFVGRGIFLARPGASLARPAWMPMPSKRGLGLAALAIAPLALIAAAQTSHNNVPDAVAAPPHVDRLAGDDAAHPEPKAQTTANKASGAAPAAAPAAPDAAPASARRPAPAVAPSDADNREPRGRTDNTSETDSETQPTPEPERPKGKGKPKDETPSSTPAPTPSGDDGGDDDRDD